MSRMLIPLTGNLTKNVVLKILFTHLETQCFLCLFYIDNNLIQDRNDKFVEIGSRQNGTSLNTCKKSSNFFVPSWRLQNLKY